MPDPKKPSDSAKKSRYYRETMSLLNTLKKHGIQVVSVNDGDSNVPATQEHPASTILSVDESWVHVKVPDRDKRLTLYIVLGNDPGEMVCDYHCHPLIEAAMSEHYRRWEGR